MMTCRDSLLVMTVLTQLTVVARMLLITTVHYLMLTYTVVLMTSVRVPCWSLCEANSSLSFHQYCTDTVHYDHYVKPTVVLSFHQYCTETVHYDHYVKPTVVLSFHQYCTDTVHYDHYVKPTVVCHFINIALTLCTMAEIVPLFGM